MTFNNNYYNYILLLLLCNYAVIHVHKIIFAYTSYQIRNESFLDKGDYLNKI